MADNPIPRPPPGHELKCNASKPYHREDTCFPADYNSNLDWSLSHVFGRSMKGICPLADPSISPVCIEVPNSRSVFMAAGVEEVKNANGRSRCYNIREDTNFEIMLPELSHEHDPNVEPLLTPDTPLLYAERSSTGHGAERGGVRTILTNPSPDTEVEFIYMESLPWFMRIYLHTLKAQIADGAAGQADVIQEVYYRPALDRARGSQLEVKLRIPPRTTVFLTYGFEKSILRYTEYPPDANRGFDVAAAVITITSPAAVGSRSRFSTSNLRTTTLLLSLPTPDFSMPYNVIIFTSTAIALAFSSMFTILVRRFVGADEAPSVSLSALAMRLVARIKNRAGVRGSNKQ